jgi:3-hydroxy-5-phosphonooxypentane-2,4-dione thiolase
MHMNNPTTVSPKGTHSLDWGMKNRLSRIFDATDGKTVMLAIDHGYVEGPTEGLERIDRDIVPLLAHADALMITRGMLRTSIPCSFGGGVVLRASAGPTALMELSNEQLAVDIEDALRLNVSALAVGVFAGSPFETQTIHNLTRLVDLGNRHGIPVLAVVGIHDEKVRDLKYFRMTCRICAELGAHIVKTYYVESGFDTIASCCPVPVVVAGGEKIPELRALTMVHHALQGGAAGVDMGRNIFQSDDPAAMIQAVCAVVHQSESPKGAFELYRSLQNRNKLEHIVASSY